MWTKPITTRTDDARLNYIDLNRIYNNCNSSGCEWVSGLTKVWTEEDFLTLAELKNLLRIVKHMGEANQVEINEDLTYDNFNQIERVIELEHDTPYRQNLPLILTE